MTTDELLVRRLVVCASGLIYWGGVMIQARRIRKRIGRSPNLKPRTRRERALWFGWFVVILAWIGQPWLVGLNSGIPGLTLWSAALHPVGLAAGLVLVALGYVGTLWTYAAMGDTWRIGINPNERTTLISRGPYRWVRHPIYALQIVMLAGAALLLPTAVSLAALITHVLCVRVKARDEEHYLRTVHGAAYAGYCARTGGLFPRRLRGFNPTPDGSLPGIDS
jgi:protein-S-isoprenylcysteine O-methyltransferase Ste14